MSVSTPTEVLAIGVLALLVVAALLWSARQKRARRASDAAAGDRRDAIDAASPQEPPPAPRAAKPPKAAPAPVSSPAADGAESDLLRLKGLGPKLAARLAELGVSRIDQIAALTPADADALDAQLGTFRGRIARDRWIEQARLLKAGDRAGYEAEFGKL